MGILDDNYSTAIEEQVEYMANLFAQAEIAVYRVKDKYEMYKNDPRSKHNYRSYREYSIIIKYDKDNKHLAHVWPCEASNCTVWWQTVIYLKKFIESLTTKGYKVTEVYTK